jgi:hypothetical protein
MQRNMQLIALDDVKHCSFDTDDLTCHLAQRLDTERHKSGLAFLPIHC